MAQFHTRTGSLVTLSNDNKTAQRNMPQQEFNNGVVLSAEPLHDNQLFEVRIDSKLNSWSGSIEIGVTTSDPSGLSFPTSASGFRDGTWVMSGSSVLKDGHATIEEYGPDLDQLIEGDRVGVMRTTNGALHFFVNGNDLGPADTRVPSRLFAIVDMYGKCSQVTIIGDLNRDKVISNEITNEAIAEATYMHSNERLLFHEHCGTLVKLTSNRRAAERRKPLDEFNNGVVMTNRPINDDEMFEIRLDRLVDKWSGSIEVGVTTHNPSTLAFPATMTNMRSGTIMMSGCGILTNGKGTQREYGDYNLDELAEGDRIGLMRLSNGSLHYYINGVDQGIAEQRCPQPIWGVVDLYGMAVKVTILDRSDPSYVEHEARARRYHNTSMTTSGDTLEAEESDQESEKLLFHPHCGYHAAVVNGQRTAHRPNAVDEFNHGVVLTNRMLRVGELFEVRLEKKVDKWAGSVDIGVTTHAPHTLEFPSTMTNIRSGTWIMTGNGVMHNGTTVLDEYGHNLDQIQVGDHVGVRRYENGDLHFVINNVDQGLAATNVPASIYGIIDLYGQACQVSIVDQSDSVSYSRHPTTHAMNDSIVSLSTSSSDELCFDHRHGKNAIITSAGKTALRPNAHAEFNDAIVMTNRPLRDNELFELTVENMVSRWSGSIEAGVSLMRPDEIDFPNTMTDLEYDTWMLSGSGVMYNGTIMRNGYDLDLDNLTTGSRIGMMRKSDGTLHFFLDGSDMGVAYADIPPGVYGMIDLYGQCSQVTITNGRPVRPTNTDNNLTVADTDTSSASQPTAGATHRFSKCCAQNVSLENNNSTARRTRHFNHGVVFSADPLRSNEMFEVQIDELSTQWGDGLHIGVTALVVCDSSPPSIVPISAVSITTKPTWVLCGSEVRYNGHVIRENYTPSLDRLQVGNRVGIKITSEGVLHLYINGDDMGPAAYHIPRNVFAVVDLYGQVKAISAVSTPVSVDTNVSVSQASNVVQDSNDAEPAAAADDDADADAAANNTVTTAANDTVTTAADTTMQQHNTADTTTHQHNNDQPLHQQHNEVTNEPPSHNNTNNVEVDADQDVVDICEYEFDNNHSKNVELLNNRKTARRVTSYNQGIVMSHQPLSRGRIYKVRIDEISSEWTSSLSIGVLATNVEKLSLPVAAVNIVKPCWVVQGNSVFHSSVKMSDRYGVNLDTLTAGTVLGVCVEHDNSLHLYVNDIDQGVAARNLPPLCYAVVDLYGQCRQVSIWDDSQQSPTNSCSEYREKADLEDVTKEKLVTFNDSSSKQCTYYNLCTRLKHLLALPDGYFLSGQSRCYCESCYKTRLDEAYLKKGDPPKDYAVPVGWCRYPIRLTNKAENQHVSEKWHVAFYGTSGAAIREILDTGDLLKSVESGGGYSLMAEPVCVEEKNKPEERAQLNQVTLSPTIKYAGHHMFASRYDFQDPASNKLHTGRFVLQVFCRPGSYKISGQSLSGAEPQIVDPLFNSTELEWSTKERGSIVLAALMVKVD